MPRHKIGKGLHEQHLSFFPYLNSKTLDVKKEKEIVELIFKNKKNKGFIYV